ncbi:putative major facilitator superfamily transporter [Mytilinidion resinicola]|uniref:Major facilitator superfamily transporter n=1 Tax=Mytilinidion resinicola TaxID=574789 RepID=A0A6A6YDB3_9PEZI|nr:putative major facilitator superfamily transporter [Mytilinidion resinicola]KAF2806812.1 putative major facilitator superfamily transporter [Mytilinidion resinicola]
MEPGNIQASSIEEKQDTSDGHFEHCPLPKDDRESFQAHDVKRPRGWKFRTSIAGFSLCLLYVGSQISLYFIGATISFIVEDIGGADKISWLPVANTLAVASTAPFSGYLQDLIGRRYIALTGSAFLIVGAILVGTAHSFGQAVTGMALTGAGSGIGELTALAGVAEIVPVNRRGLYLGLVTICIVPFSPYVMYSQLLSTHSTWRWGMWITVILNGIACVGTACTYFPKRVNSEKPSRWEILKEIDYIGGITSITGLTLFLVALQSGGYTHPWRSPYVLCTLLIGFLLIAVFVLWEWKGAKKPMIPKQIFAGQRIVALAFLVAFISGMDFYSVLNFFPLSFQNVYKPSPIAIGCKGLGPGLSVPFGAALINMLLSVWIGHNRELLLFSTFIMTVFGGALAATTPDTPKMSIAFGTIAGFGIGGVLVPAATIAITVTPDDFIATTVALSLSARVIGGSIGYALYYNIFATKLNDKLPVYLATAAIKAGLPVSSSKEFVLALLTGPATVMDVKGVTPMVLEAAALASRWAYSDSLAYVWYTSIAFGVIACIASFFIGNVRLYLTQRVATQLM